MAAIIGSNITVSVEKPLGSPITVTNVTKATEGVATANAHGLAEGDIVRISVTEGMVELDGQAVRVKNAGSDQFTLEGLDTTAYSTWSAGTATEVTVWRGKASEPGGRAGHGMSRCRGHLRFLDGPDIRKQSEEYLRRLHA